MPDSVLSATDARKENREDHEKFDQRLRRLELGVAILGLMVVGNGAGTIVAKFVGA